LAFISEIFVGLQSNATYNIPCLNINTSKFEKAHLAVCATHDVHLILRNFSLLQFGGLNEAFPVLLLFTKLFPLPLRQPTCSHSTSLSDVLCSFTVRQEVLTLPYPRGHSRKAPSTLYNTKMSHPSN